MTSIRRFLVVILLASLTLISFLAAMQGYKASMQQASRLFDNQLQTLARVIVQSEQSGTQSLDQMSIAYQVWQRDVLLYRSGNAPTQAVARFASGFSESNFSGRRWRVFALWFPEASRWVLVAQDIEERFSLAEEMTLASVYPVIISLPLIALLIWFAVGQGLRPLNKLALQLKRKKADDLSEIHLASPPRELVPVLDTTNALLSRLNGAFAREKRFASDAAHELRTPLSVLKINLHNLALEVENTPNLKYLQQGVERMGHVVDQILMLNRTTPDQFHAEMQTQDLYRIAQDVIVSLYPEIEAKGQHIVLEGEKTLIQGDEFSLSILIQNLVSNACKYTPEQGQIAVSLVKLDEAVCLMVQDTGPGIPEEEYERVLERFYRVGGDRHSSGQIGCGLGLAIAEHITQLHQGKLTFGPSELASSGLKVSFTLPGVMASSC